MKEVKVMDDMCCNARLKLYLQKPHICLVLISLQSDGLTHDSLEGLKKSTSFFTVDNFVYFFLLLASELSLCGNKHPSGTRRRLNLTLLYMLFAKRTAIIEKSFLLPQPIPLKFLSVWYFVYSLLSPLSLLSFIILLLTYLIFSLSFSLSPHFILVAFVTFPFSVLVFFCFVVTSSLCSVFLSFLSWFLCFCTPS